MGKSSSMGEQELINEDLVQVARLAVERKDDDLRLFLARLARKYRRYSPELSGQLARILDSAPHEPTRSTDRRFDFENPSDDESLPLLRFADHPDDIGVPVLTDSVRYSIEHIIEEWRHSSKLIKRGLRPISSTIFTGPPGVGKTYTARWLASQLELPLFSLDLTAVMSSRLGQSGTNLRSALDYARSAPSVLFLDEVDSIAKRRADDSDVGELKRLVTIMLQELDDWPSTSLLIAATNHEELVDPALWRRFDLHIEFPMPDHLGVSNAIKRYLGDEVNILQDYLPVLESVLSSSSYSEIEKTMSRIRKQIVLGGEAATSLEEVIRESHEMLSRSERIGIANKLQKSSSMSQHQISRLTGVSRDTIRKHGRIPEGATNG